MTLSSWSLQVDVWELLVGIGGLLAVVWLVWRSMTKPRFAVCLFVVSIVFTRTLTWGGAGSIDAQDWTSRLTWSEVAGAILLLAGFVSYLRGERSKGPKLPGFFVVWLIFLSVAAVSMGWFSGGNSHLAVSELLALTYLTVIYYVLTQLVRTSEDLQELLGAWVVIALVLYFFGGIEIFSVLFRHRHWLPFEDPLDLYRIRLTFRDAAQQGCYTLVTFFMILAYATLPGIGPLKRTLCYGLATWSCMLLLFSSKRSAYVGMAVGLCVLCYYGVRRHGLPRKVVLIPFIGLALIVGAIQLSVGLEQFVLGRTAIISTEQMEQNEFLQENWGGALRSFLDHKTLGIGYGGFEESNYDPTGNEIHSTPLRMLAELGLVGFLLFFLAQFLMLRTAYVIASHHPHTPWRLPGACLFSGLVAVLVSSIYHIHFRNREYWVMLAVLTVLSRLHRSALSLKVDEQTRRPSEALASVAAG